MPALNFLRPLLGLLMMLPWAPTAADAGGAEACFAAATNVTRSSLGLSVLPVSAEISAEARAHSQDMASQSTLYHSQASQQYAGGWVNWGENVGSGPTCDSIQQAFLASPHHYENIVNPIWTTFGVGVVVAPSGTIWVTVAFETVPVATPRPTPAPARTIPVVLPVATPSRILVTAVPSYTPTPPRPTPSPSPPTPTPIPAASASAAASPSPSARVPMRAAVAADQTHGLPRALIGLALAPLLCLIAFGAWIKRERR